MTDVAVREPVIAWPAANRAVVAAAGKAARLGIAVNAAVCDPAGRLAAFLRMPGAFNESIGIAIDKAKTAAGFGFPTHEWAGALRDNELLKLGIATRPGVVIFGGGLPILDGEGDLIGAIGVSGGSEEQDIACAQAGIDAIARMHNG
ncbi:MAG TPA: heme-binding protein [Thermopetrobacter sp.]|nr:heme-binding protein [Thermopetrobacter sp.]